MHRSKLLIALLVAALALASVAGSASSRMRSTKLYPGLCLTEGGGRFVGIPGFPGERIDRRLLRDVRMMVRRYKIFITDGFSTSPIHSAKGEHPLGLALDIVPNRVKGATWADVTALARWVEPHQNRPIPPFRWVGYDGDRNHGRGHHLHLSWSHSPAKFGKPADSVYTVRCPRPGDGKRGSGKKPRPEPKPEPEPQPTEQSGGTGSGAPPPSEPNGGVEPRLAPAAPESGGVRFP